MARKLLVVLGLVAALTVDSLAVAPQRQLALGRHHRQPRFASIITT